MSDKRINDPLRAGRDDGKLQYLHRNRHYAAIHPAASA